MIKLVKWIGVDFDNTLVKGDQLLPGAKEAMRELRDKGYGIIIHSCNNHGWIEKVLNNNEVPYDYIYDSAHDIGKPVCALYIDDNALRFEGSWTETLAKTLSILGNPPDSK